MARGGFEAIRSDVCERVRVKVVMTATTVPTTAKNGVPQQKAIVTCHLDQKKVQTIVSTQEMLSVCQNKATNRPRNRVTGNQSVWSNIFADVYPPHLPFEITVCA